MAKQPEGKEYSEDLAQLEKSFRGNVLTPSSDGYDAARGVWNTCHEDRPAVLLQCRGPSDVKKAVLFGKKHFSDGRIAVKSGGHSLSGSSAIVDGLAIDMSLNREVVIDVASKTAYIGSGCQLGDIDLELNSHGYCTPVGMISSVGYCGLALGAGFGQLTRAFGLAIDNFVEVDVVTAAGDFLRCSEETHPDLFWGLRGAGHNMGVVTGFRVKIHPNPPMASVGVLTYPLAELGNVLPYWDALNDTIERRFYLFMLVGQLAPDAPKEINAFIWYSGEEPNAVENLVAQIEKDTSVSPRTKAIIPMPYTSMNSMLDEGLATPAPFYGSSKWYSNHIDEAFVSKLQKVIDEQPPTGFILIVMFAGGALSDVAEDATAFSNRNARGLIETLSKCEGGLTMEGAKNWSRKSFREHMKGSVDKGGYVNSRSIMCDGLALDGNAEDYGDALSRVMKLKMKYDPENLFQRNENLLKGKKAS